MLGLLLTNLGTPEQPTSAAVRRYLAQFLWDRRVVDLPRPLWWLILHGLILRIRPARSARAYRKVWTNEGSPLLVNSLRQAEAIQEVLDHRFPGTVRVELGMRYGKPAIGAALRALREAGAERVLVFPLYPQYSASTTASTLDAVAAELKGWPWIPELRWINGYHSDPGYISALARSVRDAWQDSGPGEKLLFSFHGIPKRYFRAGDPYHCFCHATARAVASALNLTDDRWMVVFQSRFGREEWLKPYADETLRKFGREGPRSIDIICPGFSADCLETLEEMAQENRSVFLTAGGVSYRYIPALNDRGDHIDALCGLIERSMTGWLENPANRPESVSARNIARKRALSMGASD